MEHPRGSMRTTDERHATLRSEYGSVAEFLEQASNAESGEWNLEERIFG